MIALGDAMADGEVRLVTFRPDLHRDALSAACALDPDIWAIYPVDMLGQGMDATMAHIAAGERVAFALYRADEMVGISSYMQIDPANYALEIGGTYIQPSARGDGYNRRVKMLMLDRAFAAGFRRVQFNVDTRNGRSIAAVRKLGAVEEGVLRANRVTWTGYVRDTAVFSILAEEWARRSTMSPARLRLSEGGLTEQG